MTIIHCDCQTKFVFNCIKWEYFENDECRSLRISFHKHLILFARLKCHRKIVFIFESTAYFNMWHLSRRPFLLCLFIVVYNIKFDKDMKNLSSIPCIMFMWVMCVELRFKVCHHIHTKVMSYKKINHFKQSDK